MKAITDLQSGSCPRAILKIRPPSSLDYRAHHGPRQKVLLSYTYKGHEYYKKLTKVSNTQQICLGSVAGPVIQATGRTDFEDGSRTATTLEVSNGLHSVRTSPEVSMAGPN